LYGSNECRYLNGEIVSDKLEEDRYRMPPQGIGVTPAGKVLIIHKSATNPKDEFVLMAIYVSTDLVVTQYLLEISKPYAR